MSRRDLIGLVTAFVLHATVAYAVSFAPRFQSKSPRWVTVEVRKQPPVVKPEPPPPPEPDKPKEPPKPTAPRPNQEAPKDPPKEPPKPLFGVTMDSVTDGDSAVSVPVGNTTMTDPKNTAKPGEAIEPLAPAPAPGPVTPPKPAAPLEIKKLPGYNEGECTTTYPDGEAKQMGIEGETLLRVELDATGEIKKIRVIKGLGYGLDELAMTTLRTRCHFTPAVNSANEKVPYTLTYHFNWEIGQ